VIKLAEKYDRSPAQIAINWLVSQDNVVTIPKSTDKEHIDENLGSMDFTMDKKDIKLLNNPA
jgi:diketogulonate reductase-like aldo/keto reductase